MTLAASVDVHVTADALPRARHFIKPKSTQVILYNYPRHCGNTVGAEAFRDLRARYPVLRVCSHAVCTNRAWRCTLLMRRGV